MKSCARDIFCSGHQTRSFLLFFLVYNWQSWNHTTLDTSLIQTRPEVKFYWQVRTTGLLPCHLFDLKEIKALTNRHFKSKSFNVFSIGSTLVFTIEKSCRWPGFNLIPPCQAKNTLVEEAAPMVPLWLTLSYFILTTLVNIGKHHNNDISETFF